MQLRSTQIAENKESVKNKQERTEVVGRGGVVRNEGKEKKRKGKEKYRQMSFISYIYFLYPIA